MDTDQQQWVEVFIPGVPKPQGSLTLFRNPKTGTEVPKYSATTYAWRQQLYIALRDWWANRPVWDGPMHVDVTFLMPRPKQHMSARGGVKPTAPMHPIGRSGDIDKLVRAVLDACTQAGVWHDDSQVATLVAKKVYAGPDSKSGMLMRVSRIDDHQLRV